MTQVMVITDCLARVDNCVSVAIIQSDDSSKMFGQEVHVQLWGFRGDLYRQRHGF